MPRSVTARLTFWHTAILTILSAIVFGLVSLAVETNLRSRTDTGLKNEADEFEYLYRQNGIEALREEFKLEGESEGFKRVFFRLFSPGGEQLLASDMSAWGGLGSLPPSARTLPPGRTLLVTVAQPDRPHDARVIYQKTDDGHIIEIGVTTEEDSELARSVQRIFGAALAAMLLFGGMTGYCIARKAMRGVTRVTDAAVLIGKGDLTRRVPLSREGLEIDDLARAFNEMLERIQHLVSEIRGVTDNIAHDLRSPITRIRGIAETTLTGAQNADDYRQMAGAVIEECDRLVHMINTMLEITQADSGISVLTRAPVDMTRLASEAYDLFLPAAEERGIHFALCGGEHPFLVSGDAARLQRVVSNLLDNALKFTDSGGHVTLSVKGTADHMFLTVADSGRGISDKDLPHIFERFYRGDRSRSTPGNGLGLSLAQAIVRTHGGEITIASSPSSGSMITVRLPRISPPREMTKR